MDYTIEPEFVRISELRFILTDDGLLGIGYRPDYVDRHTMRSDVGGFEIIKWCPEDMATREDVSCRRCNLP